MRGIRDGFNEWAVQGEFRQPCGVLRFVDARTISIPMTGRALPLPTSHSYRSASTGSSFAACIAGNQPLITPTKIRINVERNSVVVDKVR